MITLKQQNAPAILLFVVWCTALFTACYGAPADFWSAFDERFAVFNAQNSLLIASSPLISLVATGLLPPEVKASLVFWRVKHVLPGHRAFTKYANQDPRVDVARLRALVDPWPGDPAEENRAWYRLLKKHEATPSVVDAHRVFLLSRDLTSIAFFFVLIGSLILFVSIGSLKWSWIYGGTSLAQYVLLSQIGRNSGIRLVKNVLAEASAKP